MSLDVAFVVIKWRKEFSSECAAFVGPVIRIVLPFGSRAVRRECRCVRPSAVAVVVVAVGLEDRTYTKNPRRHANHIKVPDKS